MPSEVLIFIWFVLSIWIGYYAHKLGRSGPGWFFLSILISPLLAWIIIKMQGKTKLKLMEESMRRGDYKYKEPETVASLRPSDSEDFKPTAVIVDVETTGLIVDNSLRVTRKNINENPENFPRIVQLCYMLIDEKGNYQSESFYIKQHQEIPGEAIAIHGITTEKCNEEGLELTEVLKMLASKVYEVDYLVGHNVKFDYKVLQAEYLRSGVAFPFRDKNLVDTMKLTMEALGRPVYHKISLYNAAEELFGSSADFKKLKSEIQEHDASGDVLLTALLYNALN